MTNRIAETYAAASAADDAFEAAVQAAGFKSRWDRGVDVHPAVAPARAAKIAADRAHGAAWEADRARVPYVETDRETAYGSTVRLSRSIRVF